MWQPGNYKCHTINGFFSPKESLVAPGARSKGRRKGREKKQGFIRDKDAQFESPSLEQPCQGPELVLNCILSSRIGSKFRGLTVRWV